MDLKVSYVKDALRSAAEVMGAVVVVGIGWSLIWALAMMARPV